MNELKEKLKALADRIDAMSVRERGLIFFAVVVVLYLIASSVVFGPLRAEQARLQREINDKRQQATALETQLSAMVNGEGGGEQQAKIESLKREIGEIDQRMDRLTTGVVSPREMAKLVEQILSRNKALRLTKLEALEPTPIDSAGGTAVPGVTVYRHGMRVQFKGRYADIVDYLKALENSQWKVFWGEVSLEADKYPLSNVSLVIYTLSRQPAWIGM